MHRTGRPIGDARFQQCSAGPGAISAAVSAAELSGVPGSGLVEVAFTGAEEGAARSVCGTGTEQRLGAYELRDLDDLLGVN